MNKKNSLFNKSFPSVIIVSLVFYVSVSFFVLKAQASSISFCGASKSLSQIQLKEQWKSLNEEERKLWTEWAKSNEILLPSDALGRVNAQKAFEIILNNRFTAGEVLKAALPPEKTEWFSEALSLRDAGPFTENAGYMGLRADRPITASTKWFVCATPLLSEYDVYPEGQFNFIKLLSLGKMEFDDLTPDFAPDYRAVFGSFNSPGGDGQWWNPPKFIWFKIYEYNDGQLSPGVMLKGRIQV